MYYNGKGGEDYGEPCPWPIRLLCYVPVAVSGPMMPSLSSTSPTELAATAAPEDLRCGDYVAVLSVTCEYPSFFWCCDSGIWPREDPVRVQRADLEDGAPLKIKAICLPFVFVKDAAGTHRTLDIRLCKLARLARRYAQKVRKKLRQEATK